MQACADAHAGERFLPLEAIFDLREDGHKRRRPLDARAPLLRERTVLDVADRPIDDLHEIASFKNGRAEPATAGAAPWCDSCSPIFATI